MGALAIEQALTQVPTKSIDVRKVDSSGDKITIEYKVNGDEITELVLNLAIAEKNISSNVDRGEKRGRTLIDDNVVRVFETYAIEESSEGRVELVVPEIWLKRILPSLLFFKRKAKKQ